MKKLVLLLFLSVSLVSYAQVEAEEEYYDDELWEKEESERHKKKRKQRGEIKTLSSNGHHGGFFAFTFKTTQFDTETIVSTGFRTGWIVSRAVAIGFEGHGILPTAKFDNINAPDRAILLGGYGGMFIEPILFSNQIVHLTFPVAGGAGWFGYHQDWEQDFSNDRLLYDDIYWYVEPGVSVEINVAKNFRLAVGASQRFTEELELFNTPNSAFDKRNYFFSMKFGRF